MEQAEWNVGIVFLKEYLDLPSLTPFETFLHQNILDLHILILMFICLFLLIRKPKCIVLLVQKGGMMVP